MIRITILTVQEKLRELAYAMDRVGNTRIADELGRMAVRLEVGTKEMSGAISQMLSDDVRRGSDQLTNVFKAALAVAGGDNNG